MHFGDFAHEGGRHHPSSPCQTAYLSEAAHEVVANWGSGQVCSAGAPTHVEEVVGAQHGVVFLGVACGGQDPVHGDGHLLKGNT